MNEVFETLSDVFEELRSESEDREYSVQTEEAKAVSRELKKKQKAFEAYLSKLPKEDREFWRTIWMWWIMPITRRNRGHIIRDLWTAYRFLTDLAL